MKLRTSLITPIVKSQIDHIIIADRFFLKNKNNYLRKVICHAAKILADNEHCWGRMNNLHVANEPVFLDPKVAAKIFILMITESAKELTLDTASVISEIEKVQESSTGFIEAIEGLIQSSLNQYADYQNYFGLLTYTGISESTLYTELTAHFALTKFRIQKGYMAVRAGNYIHENESIGWNDARCAKKFAYEAELNPNAIELIMDGLEKSYPTRNM